ncbi:MAG: pilus assembly protein [Chloroflexi bacterium]|nr:MAG: pilus assembly protein [Chloroflexota bacterium]
MSPARHSRPAASGGRLSGQAAVEFALSSVLLLLLLLGLIDFSRVFYFDTGIHGAAREGARHGAWFDTPNRTNPYLDDTDIKSAVDQSLAGVVGVGPSVYAGTCPATAAPGNAFYNPPYTSAAFPPPNVTNTPYLWICYQNNPGLHLTTPPGASSLSYRLTDLNVILTMNYGLVTGFMQSQLGGAVPIVGNVHIEIQGKQ